MDYKGHQNKWIRLTAGLLLLLFLGGCGTGGTGSTAPEPTPPMLQMGQDTGWGAEQGQSFPTGPAYTLPEAAGEFSDFFGNEPTPKPFPTEPEDESGTPAPSVSPFESPEDLSRPGQSSPEPSRPGADSPAVQPVTPANPVETPEPKPSPLEPILEAELAGLQGTWSVYVKNLDTGEELCIHDEPMVAASLIKLFVAGAYYETDPAAANAQRCSLVDSMINVSSNEACNSLIDLLGKDQINAFIRAQGYPESTLNRKMLEQVNTENYTTARECGQVLEAIVREEYVSAAASRRLLQNLKDQERTWKIPAGLPAGVETANKTGELSDTENDVCIVWSTGGTYILCVLSNDQTNVYSAREEIKRISALVYEYFTAQADVTAPAPAPGN